MAKKQIRLTPEGLPVIQNASLDAYLTAMEQRAAFGLPNEIREKIEADNPILGGLIKARMPSLDGTAYEQGAQMVYYLLAQQAKVDGLRKRLKK